MPLFLLFSSVFCRSLVSGRKTKNILFFQFFFSTDTSMSERQVPHHGTSPMDQPERLVYLSVSDSVYEHTPSPSPCFSLTPPTLIKVFYVTLFLSFHNKRSVSRGLRSFGLFSSHFTSCNKHMSLVSEQVSRHRWDTRPDTRVTIISTRNPVYPRSLDPSVLEFSLSLYRHPSICILFTYCLTSYNKQQWLDTVTHHTHQPLVD